MTIEDYPRSLLELKMQKSTRVSRTLMEKPLKILYALYDNKGELAMTYNTKEEADNDAVGPRFRPNYKVLKYQLIKE